MRYLFHKSFLSWMKIYADLNEGVNRFGSINSKYYPKKSLFGQQKKCTNYPNESVKSENCVQNVRLLIARNAMAPTHPTTPSITPLQPALYSKESIGVSACYTREVRQIVCAELTFALQRILSFVCCQNLHASFSK